MTRLVASGWPELQLGRAGLIALVACAGIAMLAIALAVLSRRRILRDAREIVESLEELRSGRTRRRPHVDASSPVAIVADAVTRLEHELHGRWAEAEHAARRWRALTDEAQGLAVITTDADGDIRSFSPGATALFGWQESEVLGRTAAIVFEESAYRDLLPKLARRALRRQGVTTRAALKRQDGTSLQAEVVVRMLTGTTEETLGFMLLVHDVSAQHEVEQQLRQSEQRHRELVENLSEAVIIVAAGRIVYANRAALVLAGRPAERLVGRPWRDLISTRDVLLVDATVDDVAQGRVGASELHCTLLGADGVPRAEARLALSAVRYEGQAATLLVLRDETAERRAERELRVNEARLDAVLEATSDGIVVLAEQAGALTVRMSNRAFAELFGLALDDYLGVSRERLCELLRGRGRGAEAVAAWIAGPVAATRRALFEIDGESAREIHVTAAPLVGGSGELFGCVLACQDRTEQRRSERTLQAQAEQLQLSKVELEQAYRRLHRVNAQLSARGQELDRINQELRRLDEMKTNLLGNVSHELQTPLVSIRGYTEMILAERLGPVTAEQRKGLTLALRNIDRLIAMIDNLLRFSRSDSRLGGLRLSRFPLRALIDEARELLAEKIAAGAIEVSFAAPEEIALEADRDKMLQVVLNLLSNAVKFSRRGGRIEIGARRGRDGLASVTVTDHGTGIPREALPHIFERSFQAPSGATREGSGFGLSIVRDLLRLHGCTIEVTSEEGRGATFTFTAPLAAPPDEAAAAPPGAEPREPPGPPQDSDELDPAALAAELEPYMPDLEPPPDVAVEPPAATERRPPAEHGPPSDAEERRSPRPRLRIIRPAGS